MLSGIAHNRETDFLATKSRESSFYTDVPLVALVSIMRAIAPQDHSRYPTHLRVRTTGESFFPKGGAAGGSQECDTHDGTQAVVLI
jgi:hypothetical protein